MAELQPEDLKIFVTESNRIEGIHRKPTMRELRAHCVFLASDYVTIADLEALVAVIAPGKFLRSRPGFDVRVGNHFPPRGGGHIVSALHDLLDEVNAFQDPHDAHCTYETLHPFMDGNGRSGRALWLWQMLNQHGAYHALRMGFLHLFYYQTLAAIPQRSATPMVRTASDAVAAPPPDVAPAPGGPPNAKP